MAGKVDPQEIMNWISKAENLSKTPNMDWNKNDEVTKFYYDTWQKLMAFRQKGGEANSDENVACAEHYAYARWFVYKDGAGMRAANFSFLFGEAKIYNGIKRVLDGIYEGTEGNDSWTPRQILKIFSGLSSENKGRVSKYSKDQADWQLYGANAGASAPVTPKDREDMKKAVEDLEINPQSANF